MGKSHLRRNEQRDALRPFPYVFRVRAGDLRGAFSEPFEALDIDTRSGSRPPLPEHDLSAHVDPSVECQPEFLVCLAPAGPPPERLLPCAQEQVQLPEAPERWRWPVQVYLPPPGLPFGAGPRRAECAIVHERVLSKPSATTGRERQEVVEENHVCRRARAHDAERALRWGRLDAEPWWQRPRTAQTTAKTLVHFVEWAECALDIHPPAAAPAEAPAARAPLWVLAAHLEQGTTVRVPSDAQRKRAQFPIAVGSASDVFEDRLAVCGAEVRLTEEQRPAALADPRHDLSRRCLLDFLFEFLLFRARFGCGFVGRLVKRSRVVDLSQHEPDVGQAPRRRFQSTPSFVGAAF